MPYFITVTYETGPDRDDVFVVTKGGGRIAMKGAWWEEAQVFYGTAGAKQTRNIMQKANDGLVAAYPFCDKANYTIRAYRRLKSGGFMDLGREVKP